MVVDATSIPEAAPAKSLTDRVTYAKSRLDKPAPLTKDSANSKAKPKSATAAKPVDGKNKTKGKQRPRTARPKRKTAEELDAEMTDYFAGGNAANGATADSAVAATGAAPAAAGDDMEEISVS